MYVGDIEPALVVFLKRIVAQFSNDQSIIAFLKRLASSINICSLNGYASLGLIVVQFHSA